jgi:hypothetical protein
MMADLLETLGREIQREDQIHPPGYPATRDGIFLGLSTAREELREACKAWRRGRCKCPTPGCDHHQWAEVEEELLQVAAVVMRTVRSIAEQAPGKARPGHQA